MSDSQTLNIRPPMWLPMILVCIGGAFYIAGKNIEVKHSPAELGTITVSGEGKASVVPDIAEIDFGMDTGTQPSAAAAMKKLSDSINKVYDAIQKSGIDKKDISTRNYSLNPVYDWTTGTQVIRGYQAMEALHVKVRDLDKLSDVTTAATSAGANQAGGVNFTVDNPEKVQAEAREKAIDQAKEKAQVLARQLGVRLGEVKAFSEGGGMQPPIMYERAMAPGMGGGGADMKNLPLPAGEQDITISVSITYEIK